MKTVKIQTTPYIVYPINEGSSFLGTDNRGMINQHIFDTDVPVIAFKAVMINGENITRDLIYILDGTYLFGFSNNASGMSHNWEIHSKVSESNLKKCVELFNEGSDNSRSDIKYILKY